MTKTPNVMAMNMALNARSWRRGDAAPGSTNWGMNARKKMVSFGFKMLSRKALTTKPDAPSLP